MIYYEAPKYHDRNAERMRVAVRNARGNKISQVVLAVVSVPFTLVLITLLAYFITSI